MEYYPDEICRAAWIILANGFLRGGSCVTSDLIKKMVQWINGGETPPRVEYGTSIGMADAIPLMQLANGILGAFPLRMGEGLALLSSNALSMAEAAQAVAQLNRVISYAEMGIALAMLAEDGNTSIIRHPGRSAAGHWPQKHATIMNVRHLLNGSSILENDTQDKREATPHSHMTLRASCDILANVKEAVEHATEALQQMMNSHQGNPFIENETGEIGSVANFDSTRLFSILTYVQNAVGCLVTSLVRRGEYKVNTFGEMLCRRSIVERYILWHLETCGRAAICFAQPLPPSMGRLSGACGIEDWASPLPETTARLRQLVVHTKRVVILESLVSAMIINIRGERRSSPTTHAGLQRLYDILVQHSPIAWHPMKQYSMEQLFAHVQEFFEDIDDHHSHTNIGIANGINGGHKTSNGHGTCDGNVSH